MPIEHINITVENNKEFADRLCKYFDWSIRWQGEGKEGGHTIHVGDEVSYIALWSPLKGDQAPNYLAINHIGVVVSDLDATEKRLGSLGTQTHSHANYEPGQQFYFDDPIGIEIEVVSYS